MWEIGEKRIVRGEKHKSGRVRGTSARRRVASETRYALLLRLYNASSMSPTPVGAAVYAKHAWARCKRVSEPFRNNKRVIYYFRRRRRQDGRRRRRRRRRFRVNVCESISLARVRNERIHFTRYHYFVIIIIVVVII